MSGIKYGFEKLILLNSANYQVGSLPLDASVSLSGGNNRGKTSLINALQYLLVIDRNQMSFDGKTEQESRQHYFPGPTSYILLQACLPDFGTVVLGCVGKGISHEPQYFVWEGPFDMDLMTDANGKTVGEASLVEHLAEHGVIVTKLSAADFKRSVYGRGSRSDGARNLRVFRTGPNQSDLFKRILARTLDLNQMSTDEVKGWLLTMSSSESGAPIDLRAEWDRAFEKVNRDAQQHRAAAAGKGDIDKLGQRAAERRALRGLILSTRPAIDGGLSEWETWRKARVDGLEAELGEIATQEAAENHASHTLAGRTYELNGREQKIDDEDAECARLLRTFELVQSVTMLEQSQDALQVECDRLTAQLQNATERSATAIERDITSKRSRIDEIERQLASSGRDLGAKLHEMLPANTAGLVSRMLDPRVLALGEGAYILDPEALQAVAEGSRLTLPGLQLDLASVPARVRTVDPAQLRVELSEEKAQIDRLTEQLGVARDIERQKARHAGLREDIRRVEGEIRDYRRMVALRDSADVRVTARREIADARKGLEADSARIEARRKALQTRRDANGRALVELNAKVGQIEALRVKRPDMQPLEQRKFGLLAEMAHDPLDQVTIAMADLPDALERYNEDCSRLLRVEKDIFAILRDIHARGLTKFSDAEGQEEEIERLVEFGRHLDDEAQVIEKQARIAVTQVSSALTSLNDDLDHVKREVSRLNRLVGERHISDIEQFRIEVVENKALTGAIRALLDAGARSSADDALDLFSQASTLDDEAINSAKDLLIRQGERNGIRVADLFQLSFRLTRRGQAPQTLAHLSKAESNGTSIMLKLVTGLSFLCLMRERGDPIMGVCYLDEASSLDVRNQRSLVATAADLGFNMILAAPLPLTSTRWSVPVRLHKDKPIILPSSWREIVPHEAQDDAVEVA